MENPALLSEWVSQGVIVQVNANSLKKNLKKDKKKNSKTIGMGACTCSSIRYTFSRFKATQYLDRSGIDRKVSKPTD